MKRRLSIAAIIKSTSYLNVGYGTSEQQVVKKVGPTFPFDGIRKATISGFYALDPQFIHLNQNLAQGYSGDVPLYATSVNTRVDTAAARHSSRPTSR